MKKAILVGGLSLATLILMQPAVSADVNYTSNASINFITNTDPTAPVDPTNPNNPFTPDNPAQAGTSGPLSIDFASSLDFGSQKITSINQTYYAALTKGKDSTGTEKSVPNYVQVTDNTGTSQGWSLKVTQVDDFKNGTKSLTGASLTFGSGNVLTATGSDAGRPTTTANYTLVKGVEQSVTTAAQAAGQGTWVTRYGNDSTDGARTVSLYVPGASMKQTGAYTTTLRWTLAQTPVSN
ncbi:hypothetical protein WOSG25_080600 [Weissella oryzae SG25]|uniref:WxL domain-containing protein n=1 Tax=Weissella oryzae (strain DSM 25784 / JCM 18191 / LMG 30913 / SG25) TaxID=1329250 RepID=A0A069CVH8_WEIOS|nr:WxL domain-containing protein [Weissella oryzae]GAK31228.1 hypothetical protein WOSG25_080600 [Weissella oryzae SG25]